MRRKVVYEDDEIGPRLKRVVALLVGIAVIAAIAVVVSNAARLSTDSITLGMGFAMGCIGALTPVLLILWCLRFVVRYMEEREARRANRSMPHYGQPPVIMMPYPQFPQWDQHGQGNIIHSGPREFTVIGED